MDSVTVAVGYTEGFTMRDNYMLTLSFVEGEQLPN
jgi:hypothetical protein